MTYASVKKFLSTSARNGRFGHGRSESRKPSALKTVLLTIPWRMLLIQLLWSVMVTAFVYMSNTQSVSSTFSNAYWKTPLAISSSVLSGVGWGLFVLLGFFIRESSLRFTEARQSFYELRQRLRQIARLLKQNFLTNSWHEGAVDRMFAHLTAFPIVLKMALRGEKDSSQLEPLLCDQDIKDILSEPFMPLHCTRVVRAYLSAMSDERNKKSNLDKSGKRFGIGQYINLVIAIDAINEIAAENLRLSEFAPSVGYVNHLRVFMYIWFFFLPLNFVQSSGWFTPIVSLVVTYGIGMMFKIASALNDPFGFDVQDIRLNRILGANAHSVFSFYSDVDLSISNLIHSNHDTPSWLEQPFKSEGSEHIQRTNSNSDDSAFSRVVAVLHTTINRCFSKEVFVPLFLVTLWTALVILGVRKLDDVTNASRNNPSCRWWCPYIPIPGSAVTNLSLGLFLVLGFWLNDCYQTYWSGVEMWNSTIRSAVERTAVMFGAVFKPGYWHQRDRERIFAHIACIPHATKATMRNTQDLSDIKDFLAPADYEALCASPDFVTHIFNVLSAYMMSADTRDPDTLESGENAMGALRFGFPPFLANMEIALAHCEANGFIGLPPNVFVHVRVLAVLWLALLPITIVLKSGPLSFLFVIPIAYSVITLVVLGLELSDPYGTDDHDIPLDTICEEIRVIVHQVYLDACDDEAPLVRDTGYTREDLEPLPPIVDNSTYSDESHQKPTIRKSIQKLLSFFPSAPVIPLIVTFIWTVIAVCLSWSLSFTWSSVKRGECRQWCSPIDVDGATLGNVGFALFLILSFRASDATSRYEQGGSEMYAIEKVLRSLAVEVCCFIEDGFFHRGDKERFVALLSQVPLSLRDELLQIDRTQEGKSGLISEEDWKTISTRPSPLNYILRVIDTYLMKFTMNTDDHPHYQKIPPIPNQKRVVQLRRLDELRKIAMKIHCVKRFPVVGSYVDHQQLFTGLWVALLPLVMTPWTGWLTILWVPIICYGVFALENIAVELVDPFGTDKIDIPVNELCEKASSSVIEAARSLNWGYEAASTASGVVDDPYYGIVVDKTNVRHEFVLPNFDDVSAQDTEYGTVMWFQDANSKKTKPSLYAHVLQSVPWSTLICVSVWTLFATYLSYSLRVDEPGQRWWKSKIAISSEVASYLSIAAFTPLGFYVRASYARYNQAGGLWTNTLRSACHSMASAWVMLFPKGTLTETDRTRIMAHIAAIPITLKMELRGEREVRELKGLLSNSDLIALECSKDMSLRCLDVLRAYLYKIVMGPKTEENKIERDYRIWASVMGSLFMVFERVISTARFLKEFTLAPGFVVVVDAMFAIWFMILPFVLAEKSGWFTVLWVPIIAYGMLGMYSVARELQQPFGLDLNDLDLDSLAYEIVQDVTVMQHGVKNGVSDFLGATSNTSSSLYLFDEHNSTNDRNLDESGDPELGASLKIAARAASTPLLVGVAIWSIISIFASLGVRVIWALPPGMQSKCSAWCSRIAVDDAVSGYVGFALFLLLGFRLLDSHSRYMSGVNIWADCLIKEADLLSQRVCQSFRPGTFHDDDIDRISGHIAAIGITLVAKLRDEQCGDALRKVLNESDASKVERTLHPTYYCIDVVKAYFMEADRLLLTGSMKYKYPITDLFMGNGLAKQIEGSVRKCEQIVNVPLPYGYIQHLRIFMGIWLLLLPLGLVESAGFLSIVWVMLIAYGLLGIEHWATELSDPFGYDASDVPLEKMRNRFIGMIQRNQKRFHNQAVTLVHPDRVPFENTPNEQKTNGFSESSVGEKSALLENHSEEESNGQNYGASKSQS